MRLIFGFDPGGIGAFGWSVVEDRPCLPLAIRAKGTSSCAECAVAEATGQVQRGDECAAVGIDAPLFWNPTDRLADRVVRTAVRQKGGPGSTVMAINSLRGACLVQGVMVGMLLSEQFPGIAISESHPKALLWITGHAKSSRRPPDIALHDLTAFFTGNLASAPDHERDAALGALSAWAMLNHPANWQDLLPLEGQGRVLPIRGNVGYWMPIEV